MSNSSKLRRYRFTRSGPNSFFAVVAGAQDVGCGTPVTPNTDVDAPMTVLIATGASDQQSALIGLATSPNEPGQRTNIQYAGPLSQPEAQWDILTGQTGGLTPGARYYLTDNPKQLGTNPGAASFQKKVGVALSTNTLLIQIETPADVGFCPDGVVVTYHLAEAGFPIRVDVDWDENNCTLDITQISNLGTQPTVQDLVTALALAGWVYAPPGDILTDRLASDNEGTDLLNCEADVLTLTWATMDIKYINESPFTLPGAATFDC